MGQVSSLIKGHEHAVPTPELHIEDGPIRGLTYVFEDGRQASAYMSIPYAKPPLGELRFQKPLPPEPWSQVRDCTKLPPRCPHQDMLHEKVIVRIPKSEDCLYLNVFTPHPSASEPRLPVMVYVHGGGFTIHSSSHYGDSNICRCLCVKNVVVVTFNYRTGMFGFMCTGDAQCPGNYGFWDMCKALEWVRDNIARFGGDPDNVTLFGQSAGGSAVDYLSLSPHTQNLFKRYISMAGNAYSTFSKQTPKRMRQEWLFYAKNILGFKPSSDTLTDSELNRELLQFLRAQTAHRLELSLLPSRKLKVNKDGRIHCAPVVDGDFFPADFNELRKHVPKKQIVTGITKYESLLFVVAKNLNQSLREFVKMIMEGTLEKYNIVDPALGDAALRTFVDDATPAKSVEYKEQIVKIMSDIMFNNSTLHLARESVKNGHDVFLYTFDYHRPNVGGFIGHLFPFKGATHSTELAYLFGKCIVSTHFIPQAEDLLVMDRFTTLFSNFARCGDPNGAEEPKRWLPLSAAHDQRTFIIDGGAGQLRDVFNEARYDRWLQIWPNIFDMSVTDEPAPETGARAETRDGASAATKIGASAETNVGASADASANAIVEKSADASANVEKSADASANANANADASADANVGKSADANTKANADASASAPRLQPQLNSDEQRPVDENCETELRARALPDDSQCTDKIPSNGLITANAPQVSA